MRVNTLRALHGGMIAALLSFRLRHHKNYESVTTCRNAFVISKKQDSSFSEKLPTIFWISVFFQFLYERKAAALFPLTRYSTVVFKNAAIFTAISAAGMEFRYKYILSVLMLIPISAANSLFDIPLNESSCTSLSLNVSAGALSMRLFYENEEDGDFLRFMCDGAFGSRFY